jgi:hypothetical protein
MLDQTLWVALLKIFAIVVILGGALYYLAHYRLSWPELQMDGP